MSSEKKQLSRAELVSFSVSVIILLALVGSLLYIWLSPRTRPAEFRIEIREIQNIRGEYHVWFSVINEGDETAKKVIVQAILPGSKDEPWTVFDYIPARSQVQGVFVFQAKPDPANLRVISFQKP